MDAPRTFERCAHPAPPRAARHRSHPVVQAAVTDRAKVLSNPQESTMKWVTRERPKIDRIACP